MNIYKISQTANKDYDTYDSAIVLAPDAETAKKITPCGDDEYDIKSYWTQPENVKVELIGTACPEITDVIILASYNAG